MRRASTEIRRAAILGFILLTACASSRRAGGADGDAVDPMGWISPPTVSLADASEYEGEMVAIDTRIASARVEGGKAILVPASSDAGGLEVVVAPPLVGPSAKELVDRFDGEDVRAVGRVTNLGGRLELLIGDPDRISIVGETVAARSEPVTTAAPAAAPAAAPPPRVAAAPPPAVAPAPAAVVSPTMSAPAGSGASTTSPTTVAQSDSDAQACQAARDAWRKAAAAAKGPLDSLQTCLSRGQPPCAREMGNLRVALAEVAASEERFHWVCRSTQ